MNPALNDGLVGQPPHKVPDIRLLERAAVERAGELATAVVPVGGASDPLGGGQRPPERVCDEAQVSWLPREGGEAPDRAHLPLAALVCGGGRASRGLAIGPG